MEPIKEALQRARREGITIIPGTREDGAAPLPVSRAPVLTPVPAPAPIPAPRPAARREGRIVYTHTRVVQIPQEHLRDHRVVAALHDEPIADAYRILRTAVLQRMRAHGWSSLAITSPADGAGKTLTAVNLAISLAREVNHTVLLADLDLRRPRLHSYFSDRPVPGISDYLLDGMPLGNILLNPGIDRLVVLPGREPIPHSSEILSAPRMVELAKELQTRYPERIVIYDMPPVLACDDVMAFGPNVDAVLLVVEEGGTAKEELKRALEVLEGMNVIGTVLNKAEGGRSGYGHY
jgi:capsular exopolysaccharide synthesis family protein